MMALIIVLFFIAIVVTLMLQREKNNDFVSSEEIFITIYKVNRQFMVYIPKSFDVFEAEEYNYKKFSLELDPTTDKLFREVFKKWTQKELSTFNKRKFITKKDNYSISTFDYIGGKNKKITFKVAKVGRVNNISKKISLNKDEFNKEITKKSTYSHIIHIDWGISQNIIKKSDEYELYEIEHQIYSILKKYSHNPKIYIDEKGALICCGMFNDIDKIIYKLGKNVENFINNYNSFNKFKVYSIYQKNTGRKKISIIKEELKLANNWAKTSSLPLFNLKNISKQKDYKKFLKELEEYKKIITSSKYDFSYWPIATTDGKLFGYKVKIESKELFSKLNFVFKRKLELRFKVIYRLIEYANKAKRKKFMININLAHIDFNSVIFDYFTRKIANTNIIISIDKWKYLDPDYLRGLTIVLREKNVKFALRKIFNEREMIQALSYKPTIVTSAKSFLSQKNISEIYKVVQLSKTFSNVTFIVEGIDNLKVISTAHKNKISYIMGDLIKVESKVNKLNKKSLDIIKKTYDEWAFIR